MRPFLGPLERVLGAVYDALARRPRATLLVTIAVTAVLAAQVPALRVVLSIDALSEPGLPAAAALAELRRSFGGGTSLVVLFEPAAPDARFTAAELAAIRDWLEHERRTCADLAGVMSPFDLVVADLVLATPIYRPVMSAPAPEALRAVRNSALGSELTDRDRRDLAAELVLREIEPPGRFGRADPRLVESLLARLEAELLEHEPGIAVHLAGPAAFQLHSLRGIRRFRLLNVAVVLLVLGLFRALFGTWRSGLYMVGVLIVSGTMVYGAMSLAGAPIDFLSTGLFLMLSVAALEDFLFITWLQLARGVTPDESFREQLMAGFLTSLTTALGFASLAAADLAIVRRFGAWAALGAVVEWAMTFLVLPAAVRTLGGSRGWTDRTRALRWTGLERLLGVRPSRRLAVASLGIYALAVWGMARLEPRDSLVELFPEGHAHRRAFTYLSRTRGWMGELSVVFPDGRERGSNQAVIAALRAVPGVVHVLDPYAALREVTGGLSLGRLRRLGERSGHGQVSRSLFAADGRTRARVYIEDVRLDALSACLDGVAAACRGRGCYPAGDLVAYAEFARRVPAAFFRSFVACLVLVGLVLALIVVPLGLRQTAAALAASFWGPAFALALMAVLDLPLTFLTCVFASVLVGLTGDNAIQFALASARGDLERGISARAPASVLVALVMAAACLTFLGSAFLPSRRLGVLLAVGLLASLLGDVWLLRAWLETRPGRDRREGSGPR